MAQETRENVVFSILAILSGITFYFAARYAFKYSRMIAFALPPFIALCIMYDNIIMASSDLNKDDSAVQAMLAFHACIIPLLLVTCYEVTYLVHKSKSVNFCGISFESGHRANRKELCSTFLRFFVWLVAIGLVMINLIVNFEWVEQFEHSGELSLYEIQGSTSMHYIFSITPSLVLVAFSLYIGSQLWKYGTHYAFIIHATYFNPWIWMIVGSLALLVGNIMPEDIFPVTSNAGELFLLICIVRTFREVHHDLIEGDEMREYIDQYGLQDGIEAGLRESMTGPVSPLERQQKTPVKPNAIETSVSGINLTINERATSLNTHAGQSYTNRK